MEHSIEEFLRRTVEEALAVADRYGLLNVGIALNDALIELDGHGRAPADSEIEATH